MRLQPTLDFAESPSATYLCTVFGLFHNAGHELLAGHELEFTCTIGIKDADTVNAIEAGIDLLAYAGYTAYVNSASADATLEPLVRALIHPARFAVGASAFFAVAKAMVFAERIFQSTQNKAPEDAPVDQARQFPVDLVERRQEALIG
jgi:hypothetical protein